MTEATQKLSELISQYAENAEDAAEIADYAHRIASQLLPEVCERSMYLDLLQDAAKVDKRMVDPVVLREISDKEFEGMALLHAGMSSLEMREAFEDRLVPYWKLRRANEARATAMLEKRRKKVANGHA